MIVGITFLVVGLILDRLVLNIDTTREGWVLLWYTSIKRERKYIKLWKKDVH